MERECRFEPDALPILCVDCEKPTGQMGTCDDRDICASCRQEYRDVGISEAEIAALAIGVISGQEFGWKPTKRVLHFDSGSGPICNVRGGPHPVTVDRNETNCKKCVRKLAEDLSYDNR